MPPVLHRSSTSIESLLGCELGCSFGVDDVGTAGARIDRLSVLPLDHVKVHGSLVARMVDDDRATHAVADAVRWAESRGVLTVAEGVERSDQADRLQEVGCRLAQGWLFGHPSDALVLPSLHTCDPEARTDAERDR